ncbi:MAG: TusE/DsrC/DsvC family sulfur relay protein [bacterium]|nr:TusE/DsrC/DsvC family sulfur relay protein [bacterium]
MYSNSLAKPLADSPRPYRSQDSSPIWSTQVALAKAQKLGLKLSAEAWAVVQTARELGQSQGTLPHLYLLVGHAGRQMNLSQKRALRRLYQLFGGDPRPRLAYLTDLQLAP